MGGGIRGGREGYAATRYGIQSNRTLSGYGSSGGSGSGSQQSTTYSTEGTKRVFISFHMEDESQVDLLRHQARSDNFDLEFTDYSVKEPFDEKWKTQCAERINKTSVVIVMIGPETHTREAVLWEINKAYDLGKTVVGVRIYKDRNDKIPEPMQRKRAKIVNWKIDEIQNAIDGA